MGVETTIVGEQRERAHAGVGARGVEDARVQQGQLGEHRMLDARQVAHEKTGASRAEALERRGVFFRRVDKGDAICHGGTACAGAGVLERRGIRIARDDGKDMPPALVAFVIRLVEQVIPHAGVVLRDPLEAPVRAHDAGRDARAHHGRLDGERSARTQRIHQTARTVFAAPACRHEHRRREVFVERCALRLARRTVTALLEGSARKVDGDCRLLVADVYADAHVGRHGVDIGAFAAQRAQAVAQRVFRAQCRKARVAQVRVGAAGGKRDGLAKRDVVFPGDAPHVLVEGVGGVGIDARDRHEHAAGDARPQAREVGVPHVAAKRNARAQRAHAVHANRAQLVSEQGLQPPAASREKLHGHP